MMIKYQPKLVLSRADIFQAARQKVEHMTTKNSSTGCSRCAASSQTFCPRTRWCLWWRLIACFPRKQVTRLSLAIESQQRTQGSWDWLCIAWERNRNFDFRWMWPTETEGMQHYLFPVGCSFDKINCCAHDVNTATLLPTNNIRKQPKVTLTLGCLKLQIFNKKKMRHIVVSFFF